MRILILTLVQLALWSVVLVAEETKPQSELAASAAEISQWVANLDSDLFEERERAQKNLTKVGAAALEPVANTAREGSLESSTRAINILLAWSEADDEELVIPALEQLATLEDHPKQASLARELLADVRENIALEALKKLGGSYQQVPPANGMVLPRAMRNWQIIIGADWKGEVDGLKHIEKVPTATTISFHSAPLDDEALAILERLPHINRVELYGTKKISPEAIAVIQKKLPAVTFDLRSGAFLGVKGTIFSETAQVGEVVPGSAADLGGVKPGDTIMKVDGQDTKDFQALTGHIGQHEPGDTVTLSVLRPQPNSPPAAMDLKVTFAEWGKNGAGSMPMTRESPNRRSGPVSEPDRIKLDRR